MSGIGAAFANFPKQLNNPDQELAEFAERIARLEAELAETRRVNAAWRALHLRSELVLDRISQRFSEVLRSKLGDDAAPGSSRTPDARGEN